MRTPPNINRTAVIAGPSTTQKLTNFHGLNSLTETFACVLLEKDYFQRKRTLLIENRYQFERKSFSSSAV